MKKIMKYLLLVNIIILITFISIGDINVNAGTLIYSHQFELEKFILDEYNNLSGVNWNTKNVDYSAAYNNLGRRFYIDTEKQQPISLYSKEEFYNINEISISCFGAIEGPTMQVYVGDVLYDEEIISSQDATYIIEFQQFLSGNVEFKFIFTDYTDTDQSIYIKSIAIVHNEIPLSISGNNYVAEGTNLDLLVDGIPAGKSVVWESSDENIAIVNNGVVTPVSVGPVDIIVKLTDNEVCRCVQSIYVFPAVDSVISMPTMKKLLSDNNTIIMPFSYSVIGYISSIDSAYDSIKNTINITISDGYNYVKAASLPGGSELRVGDTVKVTGDLVLMQSQYLFGSNATYIKIDDESLNNNKSIISQVNGYMSLGFKYNYSEHEPTSSAVLKVSETLEAYTTLSSGVNNAHLVNLNKAMFNVHGDKNDPANIGVDVANDAIRIFDEDDGNGGTLTVETKNGQTIKSIDIEFIDLANRSKNFTINSEKGDYDKTNYVINDTTFDIKNLCTEYQIWIASITINLDENTGNTVEDYNNVDIRMRMGVDAILSDMTNVDSYGISISTASKTIVYTPLNENLWSTENDGLGNKSKHYIIISLGDVFNNIERYTTEFTVSSYFIQDGITYVSSKKTYSLKTLLEQYINNIQLSDEDKEMVSSLYERLENLK